VSGTFFRQASTSGKKVPDTFFMSELLGAMFLLGLASGLHCVGMCGGLVTAFSPRGNLLLFNAGRLTSYASGGAAAGALGSVAAYSGLALSAQTALFVLANVVLVLVGLHIAGFGSVVRKMEVIGLPVWRRVQPLAQKFSGKNSFLAGAAWGFIPCGLVYGALAAAIFAGSPARGAAAMAAFGLGTLPWLLAAGALAARLRVRFSARAFRLAAGGLVLGFGVWGLARTAAISETVRTAILCL
jgi:sulfite exporter TauE/SafE